jgi:hypothetical protein
MLFLALVFVIGINASITSITLSSPADGIWTNDNTPDFSFTAVSDINSTFTCELTVDAAGYGQDSAVSNNSLTTITANTSLANGARSWNIDCTDTNGTVSSASRTLNVDAVPPTSTIDSPADGTWTIDTTPQIQFTQTDNLDAVLNYIIYVDGSVDSSATANNNTQQSISLSALANGQHSVVVEAEDEAGNTVNSSAVTINVDTAAPAVSVLTDPADNANLTNSDVVFRFNSSDNLDSVLDYTLYLNSAANRTGTTAGNNTQTQFTETLPDSSYTWTIQVEDEAGNSANYSGTYSFNLDTGAPVVNATSPNGTLSTHSVTLSATTNENSVCRYSLNDTAYASMTGNFTGTGTAHTKSLSKSNGNYVYYVRCNDTYGNVMASSANITFTVSVSGGGGGSSSNDDDEPNEIELEFKAKKGNVKLTTDDVAKFRVNNKDHKILVSKISDGKASFTLHSETMGFVLKVGETKKFDIDSNSQNYDLAVTLHSIVGKAVNITLNTINEAIPRPINTNEEPEQQLVPAPQPPAQNIEPPLADVTGSAVADNEDTEQKSGGYKVIMLLGIAATIGILAYLLKK